MKTKQVYRNFPSEKVTIFAPFSHPVTVWMETSNGFVSSITATPVNNIIEIDLSLTNYAKVVQRNQSTTFKMTLANDNLTPLRFLISCGSCGNTVNEEVDQIVVVNGLKPNTALTQIR